jgi:hypothetical protein
MEKKTIAFAWEKDTKNTRKYQEVPEPNTAPVLGTLYVQKWVGTGDVLKVTLESN